MSSPNVAAVQGSRSPLVFGDPRALAGGAGGPRLNWAGLLAAIRQMLQQGGPTTARWLAQRGEYGQEVRMQATADPRTPNGTMAEFSIFGEGNEQEPIATATGPVQAGQASAPWTYINLDAMPAEEPQQSADGQQSAAGEQQSAADPNAGKQLHPMRKKILEIAEGACGKVSDVGGEGGKKKGWELLKEIYDTALHADTAQWGWIPGIQTPGKRGGSTPQQPGGASWCGIFNVWAVIKAGNPDVQWQLGKAIKGLPAPKSGKQFEPGDILVMKGKLVHHCLLKEKNGDALTTIDGNTMNQEIKICQRSANDVWYYYPTVEGPAYVDGAAPPAPPPAQNQPAEERFFFKVKIGEAEARSPLLTFGPPRGDAPPPPPPAEPKGPDPNATVPQDQPKDKKNPKAPQFLKALSQLPAPNHGVGSADDYDGIAKAVAKRAKEGIKDVFAHGDYNSMELTRDETWARAIAEHQTGAPYTMPVYFYSGKHKAIMDRMVAEGLCPLQGQCQQSVTTAMMMDGYDGGPYGDVGSGTGTPGFFKQQGQWFDPKAASFNIGQWPDALWEQMPVGACFVWAKNAGEGHIATVMRKHPSEKKVQLWDTGNSFKGSHPGGCQKTLFEIDWTTNVGPGASFPYLGMGWMTNERKLLGNLKPRGFMRLVIFKRGSKDPVYLSAWLDMAEKGTPMSWLLRSLQGAPFAAELDIRWLLKGDLNHFLSIRVKPDGTAQLDWSEYKDAAGKPQRFHYRSEERAPRDKGAAAKGLADPF